MIARQVLALRERHRARLPLVLMNSFHTREESLEALERYRDLPADVPSDFVQNKEPKLDVESLTPVSWPDDPELEWCPPGHGDLYTALVTSGMLDALLEHDYRYAFVSNSDNLGAVLDPGILGWLASERVPFAMEVADRTAADRKGGHLARRADGRLVLREIAQTPEEDLDSFQDVERFRYFNTNTLWIDLRCPGGRAVAQRQRAGPADDPQPQDGRPRRSRLPGGVAAGDSDGRGDLGVRRRARPARGPGALRAGQDHQRAAGRALGSLHAHRR